MPRTISVEGNAVRVRVCSEMIYALKHYNKSILPTFFYLMFLRLSFAISCDRVNLLYPVSECDLARF